MGGAKTQRRGACFPQRRPPTKAAICRASYTGNIKRLLAARGLRGQPRGPRCFCSRRPMGECTLRAAKRPQGLRPRDETQFVRLHKAGMRGHDAHAETVRPAFSRGNATLVNVVAVAIGLAALI